MQDGPGAAELTRFLPWWAPWVVSVLLTLAYGADRYRKTWKRGRAAEESDRVLLVANAVAAQKQLADEASDLARLRKERIEELEADLKESRDDAERLRRQIESRAEIEDQLQRQVMRLQGKINELEDRLKAAEIDKGSGG